MHTKIEILPANDCGNSGRGDADYYADDADADFDGDATDVSDTGTDAVHHQLSLNGSGMVGKGRVWFGCILGVFVPGRSVQWKLYNNCTTRRKQ